MALRQYQYTKVADLQVTEKKVNIFGIVKYFHPPVKVSTGQYQGLYTIIDPSVGDEIEKGIRCNLFAFVITDLPHVENVGDIIRLHRMCVKTFNGKLQMQKTKGYSWLVYDTKHFDINKKKSSHSNPSVTNDDKEQINKLLQFLTQVKPKLEPTINTEITLLKDIKLETYFNCLVQIVAVNHVEGESSDRIVFTITDGTEVLFNSFCEVGNIKKVGELLLATRKFAYDITVLDDHAKEAQNLKRGDFILVTNLHAKSVSKYLLETMKGNVNIEEIDGINDWVELIVHSGKKYGRSIKVIQNDDCRVTTIKKKIEELTNIYASKMATNNEIPLFSQESLTSTDFPMQPLTSIESIKTGSINEIPRFFQESMTSTDFPMQPLTTIESIKCHEVPHKFRLRAKVVAFNPCQFQKFIIGTCKNCDNFTKPVVISDPINYISIQCPLCKDEVLKLTYLFQFLLEDETGVIELISYGDEALYFLNGTKPIELLKNYDLITDYEKKFSRLVNFKEEVDLNNLDLSTLPWIEVCLYSCRTNGHICYRLFATSLI